MGSTKQTVINGDVKEAVDTLDFIVDSLIAFWELVPLEAKMYIAVMYCVSAALQTYKVWGLTGDSRTRRVVKMERAGTLLAVALSGVAAYIYQGHMHYGWFIFAGLTAAKSVMTAHYVFVEVIGPILGTIKKWIMDRIFLAVTGKARGTTNAK